MSYSRGPARPSYARPRARRRPRLVLAGAVMTHLGGGCLIAVGLIFLFGSSDDSFLGRPAERIRLAGVTIPAEAVAMVGAALAVLGVVLMGLAEASRHGGDGARILLTFVGGVFVCVLLLSALAGDPVSALPPLGWIVVAVTLLWADDLATCYGRS